MNLKEFAEQYRLKVKHNAEDTTHVILGRMGQIYEYSGEELAVMFITSENPCTRLWRAARNKCLAAGMTLRQDGDAEGSFSFDPENRDQAELAIKVAAVKRKKRISDQHRAKLAVAGIRFKDNRTSLQRTSAP
jgi:hypothetical protein